MAKNFTENLTPKRIDWWLRAVQDDCEERLLGFPAPFTLLSSGLSLLDHLEAKCTRN